MSERSLKRAKSAPDWQNRIVGYELVPPRELLANPKNYRRHPQVQRKAMRGVLSELGWLSPSIRNINTGHLIDGHMRVEEAIERGVDLVPVINIDITEQEEALALATFDPLTALAEIDTDALDSLLLEAQIGDSALQSMCDDLAKSAGLAFIEAGEEGESGNDSAPDDESVTPTPPQELDASLEVIPDQWRLLVECSTEQQQAELLDQLTAQGYTCRPLMS